MTDFSRNWWESGVLPYNNNYSLMSATVKWSGADSEDNFNKNKDKAKWKDIDISYCYNAHGYRAPELTSLLNQPVNIALGCSHTSGIGLPLSMAWPSIIEVKSGITTINFGVGGGSCDTVAMILSNIVGLFDIQTAYILWPSPSRYDIYGKNSVTTVIPSIAASHEKQLLMDDYAIPRFFKNQKITHLLSNVHTFKIKELAVLNSPIGRFLNIAGQSCATSDEPVEFENSIDTARDGLHYGPIQHRILAERFLST